MKGIAHAKLNLTLHVTGKRASGYHELDSLVAFTEFGDHLELKPADRFSLRVEGAFSKTLPSVQDNIILSILQLIESKEKSFQLKLFKSIPVAAGLGGGSMDATLALRLATDYLGCPLPDNLDQLTSIGSDLPVCLTGKPSMVKGIGEKITILDDFFDFPVLLVNPNKPVLTREVYESLAEVNNPPQTPYPSGGIKSEVITWLREQRNDLEPPVFQLCPEIKTILSCLREQEGCFLARMSGSGGTCFGLFENDTQVSNAAVAINRFAPEWWVQPTRILPN